MLTLFRYKRNGLPCGLISVHEFLVQDIFNYFEKGRFVRKRVRKAGKSIRSAMRFARKKKTFPSKKTAEVLNALEQIRDEIEYTHQAIRTAYEESEKIIKLIRQEKVDDIIPRIEDARERFKKHDIEGGMEILQDAQKRLKNDFLPKSRKAILAGLDSEIKTLKHEILNKRTTR
jgi:hypothetical protein